MRPNQGHLSYLEELADEGVGELEDYYEKSASGEYEELVEEELVTPYYGRNVIWLGEDGQMVRADKKYLQHIYGNIFDPDKLAAVAEGIIDHPDRVYFQAPYGTVNQIDLQDVKESQEYAEDEGLDRPYTTGDDDLDAYLVDPDEVLESYGEPGDEEYEEARKEFEEALQEAVDFERGDIGQWAVTVRDGNHRAFGALIAGEPYVYVMLEDNQYHDVMENLDKPGAFGDNARAIAEILE